MIEKKKLIKLILLKITISESYMCSEVFKGVIPNYQSNDPDQGGRHYIFTSGSDPAN